MLSVPNVPNSMVIMAGPLRFIGVNMARLLLLPSLPSHDDISPIRVQTASAGPRVLSYPYDSASSIP